jgi:hypothetical protein
MKRGGGHSGEFKDKARRLMSLRRGLPHMSKSALAALVNYSKDHDFSDLPASRKGFNRCRDATFEDTPYGPLLQTVPLKRHHPKPDRDMVLIHPLAYLWQACKQGGAFWVLLKAKHAATPSSHEQPWRLVLYADEVVPGNQLAIVNARKIWVSYFSFLELNEHIGSEVAWHPIVAEPSVQLKDVKSGISQVFAAMIKMLFAPGSDLSLAGIHLVGPEGDTLHLWAALNMILQDGGAHKSVFGCKGDAGTRLCMLCSNLVSVSSGLVDEDGDDILTCSLVFEDQLRFASDDDVKGTIRRLKAHKRSDSAKVFKLREQALGFAYAEASLLFDESLTDIVNPVSHYLHDWMHGLFATGVFNHTAFWFIMACNAVATNAWASLASFVKLWTWPGHLKFSTTTTDFFLPGRVKSYTKGQTFKCSASEGLALLPIFALFAFKVAKGVPGMCQAACGAMAALADVLDALQTCSLGIVSPDHLRKCIDTFLRLCVNAGWKDKFIPKFHWLVHFPAALARWGVLPTCWVHERKHKLTKRYAQDNSHSGPDYARFVLSEVLSHQLHDVCHTTSFDRSMGLVHRGQVKADSQLHRFVLASLELDEGLVYSYHTARLRLGGLCKKSDVVILGDGVDFCVGQIWIFAECSGRFLVLVSLWQILSYEATMGYVTCKRADEPEVFELNRVLAPVPWALASGGDNAWLLLPYQYRGLRPL